MNPSGTRRQAILFLVLTAILWSSSGLCQNNFLATLIDSERPQHPVFHPLWVFLVIGETPGKLALIGGMFVIGAVTARAAVVSARVVAA